MKTLPLHTAALDLNRLPPNGGRKISGKPSRNMKPLHQKALPILLTVITVLCVLNLLPAFAGTRTWNGGATPNGNWTTPGNWNGVAPTTNDLLVFSGTTQTATTNDFGAGMPFNNISFSSSANPFTLRGNLMVLASPTDAGSGNIAGGQISTAASSKTNTILLPLALANGNHTISGGTGTGLLKLNGTLTRSNGVAVTMS